LFISAKIEKTKWPGYGVDKLDAGNFTSPARKAVFPWLGRCRRDSNRADGALVEEAETER
jgi:hypothetical protein